MGEQTLLLDAGSIKVMDTFVASIQSCSEIQKVIPRVSESKERERARAAFTHTYYHGENQTQGQGASGTQ